MDKEMMEQGVKMFLEGLGLSLDDQHLKKTPERVARAWGEEFGNGYQLTPKDVLTVEFSEPDSTDGLVIVRNIPFYSHCAHHLVMFDGVANVGYLPKNGRITGISKLARVVDMYAHRLQVQERLTFQVAKCLYEGLGARGVGVIMTAQHACMTCRGVKKPGSETVTSTLLGEMQTDSQLRNEFLTLCSNR
jgi:GTP cyclohydrolase I